MSKEENSKRFRTKIEPTTLIRRWKDGETDEVASKLFPICLALIIFLLLLGNRIK